MSLKKMFRHKFGFLLILLVIMPACTQVKEKDLYGTYIAKYSFGTEKLILKPNGEYIQEISLKGETKTLIHKGNWSYDAEFRTLNQENPLDVADISGRLKKDYHVPLNHRLGRSVTRIFYTIRLATADEGVDLVKVETP